MFPSLYLQKWYIQGAVDLLAGEPDALLSDDKNAFDVVLALIAHARLLSPAALHKLLDLVLSSCHAALDRAALSLESTAAALSDDTRGRDEYRAHVGSLEAHAFLLHSFVLQAEGAGTRAGPATGFGAPPSSASSSRAAKVRVVALNKLCMLTLSMLLGQEGQERSDDV